MEIRIGSYLAASFLLEQEPNQWDALVILDSQIQATTFVESHARSNLYLRFDDIEEPRAKFQIPTRIMIEKGIQFAREKPRLLVSCRAGQSRSTAMAYLIACRELGIPDALKLLNPARHRPNRLVIRLGESVLGIHDVLSSYDDWRRNNSDIQLIDHYEQIESEINSLRSRGASNKIVASS